jgi:hypothetical protein
MRGANRVPLPIDPTPAPSVLESNPAVLLRRRSQRPGSANNTLWRETNGSAGGGRFVVGGWWRENGGCFLAGQVWD